MIVKGTYGHQFSIISDFINPVLECGRTSKQRIHDLDLTTISNTLLPRCPALGLHPSRML